MNKESNCPPFFEVVSVKNMEPYFRKPSLGTFILEDWLVAPLPKSTNMVRIGRLLLIGVGELDNRYFLIFLGADCRFYLKDALGCISKEISEQPDVLKWKKTS